MSGLFSGKREALPVNAGDKPETFIGSTTSIEGAVIKSDGNIRIDGSVEGEVETPAGTVIVGKTGRVIASIRARQVFVAGAVKGDVEAPSGLEITSTGKLFGNITVGNLQIEQGGVFRGQSFMGGEGAPERLLLEGPAAEGETLEAR